MAPGRPPGSGGRDGRASHHISNIAHHFLGESSGSPDHPAAGAAHLVLAGPNAGSLPVRHMLGLGRALTAVNPGARVSLLEPASASPSVADLTSDGLVPLTPDTGDWPGAAEPGALRGFKLPPARSGERETGTRFLLRNLDHLSEDLLDAWERLAGRPDLLPVVPARTRCLLWCLETAEAGHLSSVVALGRLVELLSPGSLEVLVAAGAGASRGRPLIRRLSGGQRARTEDTLAAFRETLDHLLAPRPVSLTLLEAAPNGAAGPAAARYLEIAQRLSGQSPAGLAARS